MNFLGQSSRANIEDAIGAFLHLSWEVMSHRMNEQKMASLVSPCRWKTRSWIGPQLRGVIQSPPSGFQSLVCRYFGRFPCRCRNFEVPSLRLCWLSLQASRPRSLSSRAEWFRCRNRWKYRIRCRLISYEFRRRKFPAARCRLSPFRSPRVTVSRPCRLSEFTPYRALWMYIKTPAFLPRTCHPWNSVTLWYLL